MSNEKDRDSDDVSTLRRRARLNELKLKIARQNEALAALHWAGHHSKLESYCDPANIFNPRDYLFEQGPLFGAIPTTRGDRDGGRNYPVFRSEPRTMDHCIPKGISMKFWRGSGVQERKRKS